MIGKTSLILLVAVITFALLFAAAPSQSAQAPEEPAPAYLPFLAVTYRPLGITTRVSVASEGTQAGWNSSRPSVSGDNRYVAFDSGANNLVPDDTNGVEDVFVHDRLTGQTVRVSVASDGSEGNGWSTSPSISADGRVLAFSSSANNLVGGDTNECIVGPTRPTWVFYYDGHCPDIFVHDLQTGETMRVSVASDGSEADRHSSGPLISADGRFVAFESWATNLAAAVTTYQQIFVHDRDTGATEMVSFSGDGEPADYAVNPSISGDGRFVAFEFSDYTSGLHIVVHDRQTDETELVSVATGGTPGNGLSHFPSISADGRYISFTSDADNLVDEDTNGVADVFVHDRETGETRRVSVASTGAEANWGFWLDRSSISADGRYVAFVSGATNLVPATTNDWDDVFVHDRQTGTTTQVSVDDEGVPGNSFSLWPSISADGQIVAFASYATNLVAGDTNGASDIFVHERALD
jgi:Tol biopolymer transport system component